VRRLEEARAQPGAAAAPVAPDTEEARVRAAAAGKTILWVDDRPENNALIVEKLRETGFAVDAAISTRDGVRLYKRRRYDIVLSDMGRRESGRDVPDAGVQLIQELRSLGAQEPIIVYCSTRASDNFGVRARSAGATSVTSSTTELYRQIQAAAAKEDEVGG
jgi:CheY-like chemotaxis protein